MAVLFAWPEGDAAFWRGEMEKTLGPLDFRVFPETGDRADIDYALVWRHPEGDLAQYPNLKAIFSLGAGVPFVLKDPTLPEAPVVRFANDELSRDMTQHAVYWVLHFHRQFHQYQRQQADKDWTRHTYTANQKQGVGVLGLGKIGVVTAQTLAGMGFSVSGWSRSLKSIDGVNCHAGDDGLDAVLATSNILVTVLPSTAELNGLMNAERLSRLPKGAFIVNMGRGETFNDDDLLAALDSGRLGGAALDVFHTEPLPEDHPYWSHPAVCVTPHSAGPSTNDWAPRLVAENIQRIERGEAPFPIVDRERGY